MNSPLNFNDSFAPSASNESTFELLHNPDGLAKAIDARKDSMLKGVTKYVSARLFYVTE